MENARRKIEDLLEAGEVRDLDKEIVSLVKNGGVDAPLIMVLNKNIEAAQEDEDPTMLRVFVHLSSRIQV